jgi:general secretion pathway protein G
MDQGKLNRGFTLIEIVIVVAVIGILAGILVPIIAKHIKDSKVTRAFADVHRIHAAVGAFYSDRDLKGKWPMFIDPALPLTEDNHLYLLIGPGKDAGVDGEGAEFWNETGGWPSERVDRMEDHLVFNQPPVNEYQGWDGPYITRITTDPWGNHYGVNVKYATDFYRLEGEVVWVISAGANATWETDFSQLNDTDLVIGGDDIVSRIE